MNIPFTLSVKGGMQRILKALTITALALGAVSCSLSNKHYHPLQQRPEGNWMGNSKNWGGYTEKQHSSDTFTIGFESYNDPNPSVTSYFALVRAAERAAIDGKSTFFLKEAKVKSSKQHSHFPAYIRQGGYDTETVVYRSYDCKGRVRYHTYEHIYRRPDTYVPARKAENVIHKVAHQLSYTKKRSYEKHNTLQILDDALHNTRGYGKPKLDPRAKAQIKLWKSDSL